MQISFLALAIAPKKSKIVSETPTKWSRIDAVSESRGLPSKNIGPEQTDKESKTLLTVYNGGCRDKSELYEAGG